MLLEFCKEAPCAMFGLFCPEYGVIEQVVQRLPIRVEIRELGAEGPGVAAQREGATTILGPRLQGKTEAQQQQPEPWQTPSRPGRRRRAKEAFKVTTHNRFGATEEIQVNTGTSGTIYITNTPTSLEFCPEYGIIEQVVQRLPIRSELRWGVRPLAIVAPAA